MTLYHFTCEHAYGQLGDVGELVPAAVLQASLLTWWPARYVWLTDLGVPDREALGLTNALRAACDRTEYRYRVTDESQVRPWSVIRKAHNVAAREMLEGAPGARPMHWFVSGLAVPVALDQRAKSRAQQPRER